MRELTLRELDVVESFGALGIQVALQELTKTGREKSIMDAVFSIRELLSSNGLHDYSAQGQGQEHKIILGAHWLAAHEIGDVEVSLYRPTTKNGDPRIWIKGLKGESADHDVLAFWVVEERLWSCNLSRISRMDGSRERLFDLFQKESEGQLSEVAEELLSKLRVIAQQGWIRSLRAGDTGIGYTLETELGISANSSKTPDYKGIEIKSYRANRGNRKNLFAKVANWKASKLKSSAEVLSHFGYERDGVLKLYCTISSKVYNSQGLRLVVDSEDGCLYETSNQEDLSRFLTWRLDDLKSSLLQKHKETFWVKAESRKINDAEEFRYLSVTHTRKPLVNNLPFAIEQGVVTLDHLIKKGSRGVSEKGPLFKMKEGHEDILFPRQVQHSLLI